jgi:hypothetical protein
LALAMLALASVALAASTTSAAPRRRAEMRACSRRAPERIEPEGWGAAQHVLAPKGADTILLCGYSGLNAHPALSLVRSRLLTQPALIRDLVRRFDGLPRGPRGPIACPADDGSQILALLVYPRGREVRISVGETGCNMVTNGTVHRTASGFGRHPSRGPRLLARLKRLLRPRP